MGKLIGSLLGWGGDNGDAIRDAAARQAEATRQAADAQAAAQKAASDASLAQSQAQQQAALESQNSSLQAQQSAQQAMQSQQKLLEEARAKEGTGDKPTVDLTGDTTATTEEQDKRRNPRQQYGQGSSGGMTGIRLS